MNVNRHIAKSIICAKIASDAGKGYYDTVIADIDLCDSVQDAGYSTKDGFILEAIKAIKSTPNTAFRFWAEKRPDQIGISRYKLQIAIVLVEYQSAKAHGR